MSKDPSKKENPFTLKMLNMVEEVKSRFSNKTTPNDVSILNDIKTEESSFITKIRTFKELLDCDPLPRSHTTLSHIEKLKFKIEQLSCQEIKESIVKPRSPVLTENYQESESSVGNIEILNLSEIKVKEETKDFSKFSNKINKIFLKKGFFRIRKISFEVVLRRIVICKEEKRKGLFIKDIGTLSGMFVMELNLKDFCYKIETIYNKKRKKQKTFSFKVLKAKTKTEEIAERFCSHSNFWFLNNFLEFSIVFKFRRTFEKLNKIKEKIKIRESQNKLKNFFLFRRTVNKLEKIILKKKTDLVASIINQIKLMPIKCSIISVDSQTIMLNQSEISLYNIKRQPVSLTSSDSNPSSLTSGTLKQSIKNSSPTEKLAISQNLTNQKRNTSFLKQKQDNFFLLLANKIYEKKVNEVLQTCFLIENIDTEKSLPNNSLERHLSRKDQFINTKNKTSLNRLHKRDDSRERLNRYNYSINDLQKNESFSRTDFNSCLKESMPDSEFVRYCEQNLHTRKVNYNFSFDNMDFLKNVNIKTDSEFEKGESFTMGNSSGNERGEGDINMVRRSAPLGLKEHTVDFLKSSELERNLKANMEIDFLANHTNTPYSNHGGVNIDYMNVYVENGSGLVLTPRRNPVIIDPAELTEIMEESTINEKSNITTSRNFSNMQDSLSNLNSNTNKIMSNSKLQLSNFKKKNISNCKSRRIQTEVNISPRITLPKNSAFIIEDNENLNFSNKKIDKFENSEELKKSEKIEKIEIKEKISEKNEKVSVKSKDKTEKQKCKSENTSVNIRALSKRERKSDKVIEKFVSRSTKTHSIIKKSKRRKDNCKSFSKVMNFNIEKWKENYKGTYSSYKASLKSRKAASLKQSRDKSLKNPKKNTKKLKIKFPKKIGNQKMILQKPSVFCNTIAFVKNNKTNFRKEAVNKRNPRLNEIKAAKNQFGKNLSMVNKDIKPKSNFGSLKAKSNKSTNFKKKRFKSNFEPSSKNTKINFVELNKKQAFSNNIGRFFTKGSPNKISSKILKMSENVKATQKNKTISNFIKLNDFIKHESSLSRKNISLYGKAGKKRFHSNTRVLNKENSRSSNKVVLGLPPQTRSVSKSVKRIKEAKYRSPIFSRPKKNQPHNYI